MTSDPCKACDGCGADGPSRRRFLQTAAGGLLGVLTLLGLSADEASALPMTFGRAGTGSTADEKRYPIPATDSVTIDRDESLIIARVQRHIYAFNLACPHQQAAVRWIASDDRFQCTKHGSRYTPQGVYLSGRATRNLDRFAVRRDANAIVVNLDRLVRSDTDPAGWAAAAVVV